MYSVARGEQRSQYEVSAAYQICYQTVRIFTRSADSCQVLRTAESESEPFERPRAPPPRPPHMPHTPTYRYQSSPMRLGKGTVSDMATHNGSDSDDDDY
jgi:hypothetical protein